MSLSYDEFLARFAAHIDHDRILELVNRNPITRDAIYFVSDYGALVECLDRLLDHYPDNATAWFWRGYSYYFLEPGSSTGSLALWQPLPRFEETEAALDRAIKLSPTCGAAVLMLCHLYAREARRQVMVWRIRECGWESAEALNAAAERDDVEQLDEVTGRIYKPFPDEPAPDYSAAERVWEDAKAHLELQWDSLPDWFLFKSEFDGETNWVLEDYDGWIRILEDLADGVFSTAEATWLIGCATAHADGTSLISMDERIRRLEWALETGITEPTYRLLCRMYLLRANCEVLADEGESKRNIQYEITDFEEVVNFCEAARSEPSDEYRNFHLIRRDLARFLLDWLAVTPDAPGEPAVTRVAERALQFALTGEYGETETATRLVHFVGQQQMDSGELDRAEESLRRAFAYLRSEVVAIDLAALLVRMGQEEEAIDILKLVRSPSRVIRQYLATLSSGHEKLKSRLPRDASGAVTPQSLQEMLLAAKAILSAAQAHAVAIQESTRTFSNHATCLEQRLEDFHRATDPERAAEAILSQASNQLKWVEELTARMGSDLQRAPAWFRSEVISIESTYQTIFRSDKQDFTSVVFLWGKLVEKSLQEGLLVPFGAWLDERRYSSAIPEGKRSNRTFLNLDVRSNPNEDIGWTEVFGNYTRCDQLLVAAIDDPEHEFRRFIESNKADVVNGRWLKREEFPRKLTHLREASNRAAHGGGRLDRGALTFEDVDQVRRLMWKDYLMRDLCNLLTSTPAG